MYTMKIVLLDILLICAFAEIFAAKRGHRHLRAEMNTQAGYTKDKDTCKKYNENLTKMWAKLSKYMNSTDEVEESALHNIAVMVGAYLDHHTKNPHNDDIGVTRDEKKKDKITKILKKIKKFLGFDDATDKVKKMILQNFKPKYDDDECKQINEDNLFSSIDLSYKNYLDNARCHGDYDTGLLRGKALLRGGPPENADTASRCFHDLDDNMHKSILDEDETLGFHRGKPSIKRFKRINTDNREKHSVGFNTNQGAPFKTRSGMLRRRRPRKSSKKRTRSDKKQPNIRSDESCVKYAKRKFLITLRTTIDRFMDLRDCQHDDTLRISNRKRKLLVKNTNIPTMRITTERNDIQKKMYIDAAISPQDQTQVNNYLRQVQDFNVQNPPHEKLIYVVHSTAYKNPVLLKTKNNPESLSKLVVLHRPTKIIDHNHKSFSTQTKYNINNVLKSFLDSSDMHVKDAIFVSKYGMELLNPKQTLDASLYELIKKKAAERNTKSLIDAVTRQNDDSNPFTEPKVNLTNNSNASNRGDVHYNHGPSNGVSVNFDAIGNIIYDIHNPSLTKPQVDMLSSASESEKGYVALSYLLKYPKSIIYRPQYVVKNILQYEDFVKIASQIYITDDDRQLLKIVRYLPDNTTQTLFETQNLKSPFEINDVSVDKRRNHYTLPDVADSLQLRQQSAIKTENYSDYDNQPTNQTISNTNDSEPLRKGKHIEENPNRNVYRYDENDYSMYQDRSNRDNINENLNDTLIASILDDTDKAGVNPDADNSIDLVSISENEDAIVLKARLNSAEILYHKDELDLKGLNNSTAAVKDAFKINAETKVDNLRFKLNGDSNLSSASQTYLKELESQGVSSTALAKSMLKTWWESWKKEISAKVQSIDNRISSLVKILDLPSKTNMPTPNPA